VFRQTGIYQAGRSQRTHFIGIPAVKERGQMVHLETDVILKHQVRLIKPGSRAQVLRPIRDFDQHRSFIQEGFILCGQPGERINPRRRQVRRRQGGGIGGVSPGGWRWDGRGGGGGSSLGLALSRVGAWAVLAQRGGGEDGRRAAAEAS